MNRLWKLVNDRLNYLTPTKKPVGWGQDKAGRRKRLYDKPQTPLDRLLAAGTLAPAQERELIAYRDQLNPAAIAREIADIQAVLLTLAKDKTEQLYLATRSASRQDARESGSVPHVEMLANGGGQQALIRMPLRTSGRAVGTVAR